MTLIVAMKAAQGIVLAADSRGTVGDPRGLTAINDSYMKLAQFGRFGVAVAGASEIGATLLDEVQKRSILTSITNIDEAASRLAEESANAFTRWFGSIPHQQRQGILITLAGYRVSSGRTEPMIYLMSSQANFAPQLFGHMPCLSGVPQYAVYLVHRYYDPSISLAKAKALAAYLITETASQDPKVGGPVRIAEITPENGYRLLSDAEVTQIHSENQTLNTELRNFFLRG